MPLAVKQRLVHVHVASQKLDLQRHNSFADPDHGKDAREDQIALVCLCSPREEQAEQQAEDERAPQVPVAQALAHAALQQHVRVWPSACQAPDATAEAVCFTALSGCDATALLHHAAEQVLGVQHLLQLLPDGQQIARQRLPHGLVDGVGRRAAVLAWDARGQIRLRVCTAGRDPARQRRAVRGPLQRVIEVVEGRCSC